MSHRFSNGNASPQLRIGFAGRMTFEIPADEFVTFRLSQDEKSIATGFGLTHMPTVVSRATGSVLRMFLIASASLSTTLSKLLHSGSM